ncbi:TIGR02300 family protein [Litorivita pollutaquae]|uniref:TIGR02300 family protein n=1 Tax=Litorivita pollutaquae TaxID=2200892 RepID=A0A2V4NFA8_9RHOB|nr:TIGR02300 family protein [Litorivita pollutaquae]OUS20492.1 TIGR02300 family protein [Rhodobacterales bacterium 59_46_T64]PYC49083.1 TIGR02300 family protein [Litorivita pollutaquae]
MPNEEWGTKRVCPTTGKRFYDLNKNPIVSPYTGEVVEIDLGKSRMIAADAEDASSKKAKEAETEEDAVVLDDDEDVDLDLGDDVLEDDDDDDDVSLDEIADVAADDDDS